MESRRGEAEHCVDVCLCSSFGRCSSKAEPRPSLGNDAAGHNTLQWPTVYGRPITARRNYISNSEVTGCPNSTNHFKQLLLKLIRMSGFDCVHAWDWGGGGGCVFADVFTLSNGWTWKGRAGGGGNISNSASQTSTTAMELETRVITGVSVQVRGNPLCDKRECCVHSVGDGHFARLGKKWVIGDVSWIAVRGTGRDVRQILWNTTSLMCFKWIHETLNKTFSAKIMNK